MANLAVYMQDAALVRDGAGEVPNADWSGGANKCGSNAQGSANTGDYDPDAQSFTRVADTAARNSQHIGQAPAALQVVQGADVNDTLAFVQTAGVVAPDGVLDVTTGAVNRTGKSVPSGFWSWGVIPVA